jgi:lycopene cyclase domain-containing protein
MDFGRFTYFALMAFTLLAPLSLSFDKRVHFHTRWKALLPALVPMFLVFIVWDIIFTRNDVWWFNHDYVLGWFIAGLPVEEWSFFLIVPFACVFIYDVLKHYFPVRPRSVSLYFATALGLALIAGAIIYRDRTYTVVNFTTATLVILAQLFIRSDRTYLTAFYFAYLVCMIPFLIVNGILTKLPVVGYNDLENMEIRVTTIPLEDFIYLHTILLMSVTFYEVFKKKFRVS